ncbi:hypothetical protein BJ742DRAFT_807229 [Cladochytrium replicatum]|nr:hypothetical protein BJ742DRAFT_807229 [Cladochytrium replicatum]
MHFRFLAARCCRFRDPFPLPSVSKCQLSKSHIRAWDSMFRFLHSRRKQTKPPEGPLKVLQPVISNPEREKGSFRKHTLRDPVQVVAENQCPLQSNPILHNLRAALASHDAQSALALYSQLRNSESPQAGFGLHTYLLSHSDFRSILILLARPRSVFAYPDPVDPFQVIRDMYNASTHPCVRDLALVLRSRRFVPYNHAVNAIKRSLETGDILDIRHLGRLIRRVICPVDSSWPDPSSPYIGRSRERLRWAQKLFRFIIQNLPAENLLEDNATLLRNLLDVHVECGDTEGAETIFAKIMDPGYLAYASMIKAYSTMGRLDKMEQIVREMTNASIVEGVREDYGTLIGAYARAGKIQKSRRVFEDMASQPTPPSPAVYSAITEGYARHGFGQQAVQFWEDMVYGAGINRRQSAFALLSVLECLQQGMASKKLISELLGLVATLVAEEEDVKILPMRAYALLATDCGRKGDLNGATDLRERVRKYEELRTRVEGAALQGFLDAGLVEQALEWFTFLKDDGAALSTVTYTMVMDSCVRNGRYEEAAEIYNSMRATGVEPDGVVLAVLVRGQADRGNFLVAEGLISALRKRDDARKPRSSWGFLDSSNELEEHEEGVDETITDENDTIGRAERRARGHRATPLQVAHSSLIRAYCRRDLVEHAMRQYHQMVHHDGQKPTKRTIQSMLNILADRRNPRMAVHVMKDAVNNHGVSVDVALMRTLFRSYLFPLDKKKRSVSGSSKALQAFLADVRHTVWSERDKRYSMRRRILSVALCGAIREFSERGELDSAQRAFLDLHAEGFDMDRQTRKVLARAYELQGRHQEALALAGGSDMNEIESFAIGAATKSPMVYGALRQGWWH